MKIRIIGNRVLVKPNENDNIKSDLIIIPESAKGLSQEGVVEIVGDGLQFGGEEPVEMFVKVGDKVFFGKKNVKEIKVEGKPRLIMSQDNVLGKVE